MWYSFILLTVLSATGAAHAQKSLNQALLKREAQIFEGIVHNVLKQNFPTPFAISNAPKGTYLQGYGVVVFFHLNLNRGKIRTPFGEIDPPKGVGTKKKGEQIRLVKETMISCLADYGGTIKQLGGHDRISISAHLEDRNELDPTKRTTVMVLTVSKDDVDLVAMKKISLGQFKERLHVLRY